MKYRTAYFKAWIAEKFLKTLLRFPDAFLEKIVRWAGVAARLFAASADTRRTIEEARVIFATGGAGTQIVRRMFEGSDPRRMRMILRGNFLKPGDG
jgi:hypothetical protein